MVEPNNQVNVWCENACLPRPGDEACATEGKVGHIRYYDILCVYRRLLVQTRNLARKPMEDPAKQLLLGHVADRVIVRT